MISLRKIARSLGLPVVKHRDRIYLAWQSIPHSTYRPRRHSATNATPAEPTLITLQAKIQDDNVVEPKALDATPAPRKAVNRTITWRK
ncbi:MAG: hypothetical protein M3O82_06580 [Verrucomicrobiota bacterium]|nr:hypothetical protein [Verrucomicrobiota bacterium]